METTDISRIIQNLPMPLAQIAKRSVNAKSATDRHNNGFYLGEAGLKLAAAARIGVWMEHVYSPQSSVISRLEKLVRPSLGTWVELFRVLDEELAKVVHASQLPLGEVAGEAGKGSTPTPALAALVQAVTEQGILKENAGKFRGLLGYFSVLVAYRNRVLGHGAQRQQAFYDTLAPLLLQAGLEAFSSHGFLQDYQLAVAQTDDQGQRRWMALTGLGSLPLSSELEGQLPQVQNTQDELYLVGKNTAVALAPLVMVRTELEQERVGFLNETVLRERTTSGESTKAVTRVEYLDYATGATLNFGDAQQRLSQFLGKLHGKEILTEEELANLEHSDSETPKALEETEAGTGTYLGEFELLDRVGRGGMGEVFRARHRSLRRVVALKVLPREASQDFVALERFRREYRALWECDHPNVVKIYTFGEDKGRFFYTMDYVDGADLGRVQKTLSAWKSSGISLEGEHLHAAVSTSGGVSKPRERADTLLEIPVATLEPPPEITRKGDFYYQIAKLFAEAADGLAHLHEKGIVHRDIKPGNLMLTSDARHLVLLDLGLAKIHDASRELTQDFSRQLGTLAYMAPEQLHAQHVPVDFRADIYSLGVCLFELATGRRYYEYEDDAQLKLQILQGEMRLPEKADPAIPRDLAAIIFKAIQKNPANRYASAQELAQDLTAFSEFRPVKARPPSLGVRLSLWWHRHPQAAAGLAGALAVVVLVAAGAWGWRWWHPEHPRVRTRLCTQAVERYGVLTCAFPVTPQQQRRRQKTYRFTEEQGRVVKVELINGSGFRTDGNIWGSDQETAQWEYEYNQKGEVVSQIEKTASGKFLQKWVYADRFRRDRKDANGSRLRAVERREWGIVSTDGALYTQEKRIYDENGCVRSLRFFNDQDNPQRNPSLDWGYEYDRDENCLVLIEYQLDDQGKRATDRLGVAKILSKYNRKGYMIESEYFGQDGKRFLNSNGFSIQKMTYDDFGNLTDISYQGLDEKPTLHKDGNAGWKSKYDEHGNRTELWFFGLDGKITLIKNGIAGWTAQHDKAGNRTEIWFYGSDRKLTLDADGMAGAIGQYQNGKLIKYWYYGLDKKLTLNKNGISGWDYQYNERGNLKKSLYYGMDEMKTIDKNGCAGYEYEYDANGRQTERWCLDTNEKKSFNNDGLSGLLRSYNSEGDIEFLWLLKPNGEKMFHSGGYAGWKAIYDEFGNTEKISYFGIDGKPTTDNDGIAGWEAVYNKFGKAEKQTYFGLDGKPTLDKDGWAGMEARYNERGNETERRILGVNNQLVLNWNGVAGGINIYNDRGEIQKYWYIGADGNKTLNNEGICGGENKYNQRGDLEEEYYTGLNGDITLNNNGYAGRTFLYDPRGNETDVWLYGQQREITNNQEGNAGWTVQFDLRGNRQETWAYGLNRKKTISKYGYSGRTAQYDRRDNLKEMWFFDTEKNLTLSEDGISGIKYKYNERDRREEVWYYGTDRKPTKHKDGYAGVKYVYNERGSQTEVWYLGIDNKLTNHKDGYAGMVFHYNERGIQTEARYFDENQAPALHKDGYSWWKATLNHFHQETERWYFGKNNEPVSTKDGYHGVKRIFDTRGEVVEEWYYRDMNTLTLGKDGVAGWRVVRDARGRETERWFFGLKKEKILNQDRIAGWKQSWSDKGRLERKRIMGLRGNSLNHRQGYSQVRMSHDIWGNQTEEHYLDENEKPVLHRETKIAGWKKTYSPQGNVLVEEYFNVKGEVAPNAEGVSRVVHEYHPNQVVQRITHLRPNGQVVKEQQFDHLGEEIKPK